MIKKHGNENWHQNNCTAEGTKRTPTPERGKCKQNVSHVQGQAVYEYAHVCVLVCSCGVCLLPLSAVYI